MKYKNIKLFFALALISASSMAMDTIVSMADKYPFEITAAAKEKTATVRISGVIWNWNNNAEQFRRQVEKFNADGVTHLHLYINTPGGSVIEANEIANIIRAFNGRVTGESGALIASAGTYIALECDTFEMPPNGQFMYHKPMARIEGNEDEIESQLVGLKNFTSDYKQRYAAKTKLTEAQIEKKWTKGDVWLNATQALKDGFITGIKKDPAKITENTTALFAACGIPKAKIPKSQTPKTTTPKTNSNRNSMNELEALALKLGLPQDSTQATVDAHLAALQTKAATADQLALDAEAKEKTEQAQKIKDLFAQAITDKKLNAKQTKGMQSWAESDFDGCKAHIDGLPTLTAISQNIKGNVAPSASAAAVADKAFDALTDEEQNDLLVNDPKAYAEKYEAYLDSIEN